MESLTWIVIYAIAGVGFLVMIAIAVDLGMRRDAKRRRQDEAAQEAGTQEAGTQEAGTQEDGTP